MHHSVPAKKIPIVPLIIVVILVAVVGVWFLFFSNENNSLSSDGSISGCANIDRSSYSISPLVFDLLPPPPACFYSVLFAYEHGMISDPSFVNESYYLQPEFFPSFVSNGLPTWEDPVATHYGAVGYGAHPIRSSITLSPSSESSTRFFIFSGFGTRSLQQAKIVYSFPNPSDASLVSISLDDASAHGFLLGPTFPQFTPQWVKPVMITVYSPGPLLRPVTIIFRVAAPDVDFSSDPLAQLFPVFDATSYVGERDVFALTVSPSP